MVTRDVVTLAIVYNLSYHECGGGRVPDRSRVTVLRPEEWRPRTPKVPGSRVSLIIDKLIDGADLYGGINVLEPGRTIPAHWHDDRGELQFILSGVGVALDGQGGETLVGPHHVVFAPGGPEGTHGFRNDSNLPLVILFFYPSAGGEAPPMTFADAAAG